MTTYPGLPGQSRLMPIFWPSLMTALPFYTLRSVLVCLINYIVTPDSRRGKASEANPAPSLIMRPTATFLSKFMDFVVRMRTAAHSWGALGQATGCQEPDLNSDSCSAADPSKPQPPLFFFAF